MRQAALTEFFPPSRRQAVEHDPRVAHVPGTANRPNDASGPCVVCGGGDDEGTVMVCEACDAPFHALCAQPRVEGVFEGGDWLCNVCR